MLIALAKLTKVIGQINKAVKLFMLSLFEIPHITTTSRFSFKILVLITYRELGDWGLGIGDWAQSPIPNYLNYNF